MTNFEKIKNMSVEEMAKEIERISNYICGYYNCKNCPFNVLYGFDCSTRSISCWLENEVEE